MGLVSTGTTRILEVIWGRDHPRHVHGGGEKGQGQTQEPQEEGRDVESSQAEQYGILYQSHGLE